MGIGSLKGQEMEKAVAENGGPLLAIYYAAQWEQAGDKENNLQQLSKAGRGHGGEWKPPVQLKAQGLSLDVSPHGQ